MKIALIGNQNCGKTTLFNALTGGNQKVGNWPGVTIERKEGKLIGNKNAIIVDLPGIYSLSPYTSEEEVSRNYLLKENPDLIINIVDATSMERSLYLTTQLLELDTPMVLALNMCDLLEKKGVTVDEKKLAGGLGVPVIRISALKRTGIDELIKTIQSEKTQKKSSVIDIYPENVEKEIKIIEKSLKTRNKRFIAIKNLEQDVLIDIQNKKEASECTERLEKLYGYDIEQIIANERYNFIVRVCERCYKKTQNKISVTEKIDKFMLNKWIALPIFAIIMGLVYLLSVGVVGSFTVDYLDGIISNFGDMTGDWLASIGASDWSVSLVVQGVIAGMGAVLVFIPQLIIMFACISILETTGYMSRIAFIFDKLFRKMGLSGKSLVPFIVGSGCSVPAIMSTRTIENNDEKSMTVMLTPFIPCSAKLPIIALFAGFFFPHNSGLVSASLYFFAIAVIIISALVMKKFLYKKQDSSFISELPEYKLPSVRYVARDVFGKTWSFIQRAGTVILFCSIIIWFLSSFSWKFEYDSGIENSILASVGNLFGWFFYPIVGKWSWAASISAIQGLVAKEQVVSSMTVIAGLAEGGEELIFSSNVFAFFNPASAYAFMVFNLFSAPCFGAIGAMRNELGSTKKTVFAVLFQTLIAWALASLTFGIGSLIMLL